MLEQLCKELKLENEKIYEGFYRFIKIKPHPDTHFREVLETTDSGTVLIHDPESKKVLMQRQKRAGMMRFNNPEGWGTEPIAGRFDRPETVRELMKREIFEETSSANKPGIKVDEMDIELLNQGNPMILSAGASTEKAYLGLVSKAGILSDVNLDEPCGNSQEGEEIYLILFGEDELGKMVFDDVRTMCLVQHLMRKLGI